MDDYEYEYEYTECESPSAGAHDLEDGVEESKGDDNLIYIKKDNINIDIYKDTNNYEFIKWLMNLFKDFNEMYNINNISDCIFILYTLKWDINNLDIFKMSKNTDLIMVNDNCDICLNSISLCNIVNTKYNCVNHCKEKICKICYSTYFNKYLNKCRLPKKCMCCKKSKIYTLEDYSLILNTKYSTYELNNLLEKYLLKDCLNNNSTWFNCINDKCNNIIKKDICTNICYCNLCNIKFCSLCMNYEHSLVNCNQNTLFINEINKIQTKYIGSSDTFKQCPNCCCCIEKINNTCLKMKCKLCNYCFCWECEENYETHIEDIEKTGFYKCNKQPKKQIIIGELIDEYILLTTYISNNELTKKIINTLKQFIIFLNFNDEYYSYINLNIMPYYTYLNEIIKSKDESNIHKINKAINILMAAKKYIDKNCIKSNIKINMEDLKQNHNVIWFVDELELFSKDISKQIHDNYLLLNYEFTIQILSNNYFINLKDNIIFNTNDPHTTYKLKLKYIEDSNCPQCTFYNKGIYNKYTTCDICNFIYFVIN